MTPDCRAVGNRRSGNFSTLKSNVTGLTARAIVIADLIGRTSRLYRASDADVTVPVAWTSPLT